MLSLSQIPRIAKARQMRAAKRILASATALGTRNVATAPSFPTGDAARVADYLRTGQGTIGRKCRTHGRGTKKAVKAGTAAKCKDDARDNETALGRRMTTYDPAMLANLLQSAGSGGTGFQAVTQDVDRPVHMPEVPYSREDEIADLFAQADRF